MTELEVLQRARLYMEKLANGIDPITDREAPEEDIINNVRLSRCFFYVSGVLAKLIENGGEVGKAPKASKRPFALTREQADAYLQSANVSLPVTGIAQRLNNLAAEDGMKKLSYNSITRFLMESGLLEEQETPDGKTVKRPTEAAGAIGIYTEERVSPNGPYTVVLYSPGAQHFLLDNIDAILEINNAPKGKSTEAEQP